MYEVEVKVRADLGPIRARLGALGAEARGTVAQVDTYYDHPGRHFAATDEALRIRRESRPLATGPAGSTAVDPGPPLPRAILTYKGPLVDESSKTRNEVETTLGDADDAAAILEALGFSPVATVEKRRERFRLGDYLVVLDRVSGLGSFVEVEAAGEEPDIPTLRDGAQDRLRELGLDPDAGIRTSYLELQLAGDDNRE